jgi:hypothetical protein
MKIAQHQPIYIATLLLQLNNLHTSESIFLKDLTIARIICQFPDNAKTSRKKEALPGL